MTPYERLKQLGLELPTPAVPVANYVPFVLANGFLYLSGQGPKGPDGKTPAGKVGSAVSVDEAYAHARQTGRRRHRAHTFFTSARPNKPFGFHAKAAITSENVMICV